MLIGRLGITKVSYPPPSPLSPHPADEKSELLVSFFNSALPLLSDKKGSSILVTLFEGEPYSLWNIRDLGRHCGLEVARSWKFQPEVWVGYAHCRTLGVIKGRDGRDGGGEKDGGKRGWKGEERKARCFEFVRRGEGIVVGAGKGKKDVSSDEDDEDLGIDGVVENDLEDGNGGQEMNGDLSQDESETNTADESWEGIESDSTPDESNGYEDVD